MSSAEPPFGGGPPSASVFSSLSLRNGRRRSLVRWRLLLALVLAPALAFAKSEGLTPVELDKVRGELHGVIQNRLPVDVLIFFNAPRRDAIITQDKSSVARLQELEAYLDAVRAPLLRRLEGRGFELRETFDHLDSIYAVIVTVDALKRVLSDPAVDHVTGNNEYRWDMLNSFPLRPVAAESGADTPTPDAAHAAPQARPRRAHVRQPAATRD